MKRVVRDKQREIDREERLTSRTKLVGMMMDIPVGLAGTRGLKTRAMEIEIIRTNMIY